MRGVAQEQLHHQFLADLFLRLGRLTANTGATGYPVTEIDRVGENQNDLRLELVASDLFDLVLCDEIRQMLLAYRPPCLLGFPHVGTENVAELKARLRGNVLGQLWELLRQKQLRPELV